MQECKLPESNGDPDADLDIVTEVLRWNQIIGSSRMKDADSDESEIKLSKPMRYSHVCSNQIRMQLSHKLATLVVVPI